MASTIQQFLREHGISEVEAIIPDMAGIARGKLMPAEKFAEEEGMRLPEAIFLQTVTGDYPDDQSAMNPSDIDIVLKADPKTVRVVPWAAEPTAQVIHDCRDLRAGELKRIDADQAQQVVIEIDETEFDPTVADARDRHLATTLPQRSQRWLEHRAANRVECDVNALSIGE